MRTAPSSLVVVACLALVVGCGSPPPPVTPPAPVALPVAIAEPIERVSPLVSTAQEDDSPIPISKADATWGSRNAPVTIVFFGDFECPFTGRSVATIKDLQEKYGPDALRIVWKNEPLAFHRNAKAAAEAAQTVLMLGGEKAFWSFFDNAFANQRRLSPESYETWVTAAGVDLPSYVRMSDAHAGAGKVEADVALGKKLGVNGTPQFFINGTNLSGAQPLDKFVTVVDAERVKAAQSIASGTPKDRVYVAMSTANFKPPQDNPPEEEKPDTSIWKIGIGTSPVRGDRTALVTIVEFCGFQDPFCKRVQATLEELRTIYGDKIRTVWKDRPLPFHPRGMPAAEIAREARAQKGEAGFWAAHDALFDSSPKLEERDLDAVAQKVGIDAAKVREALRTHRHKTQIDADIELGEDFEASGTPHFFVNGRRLVGAQPLEKFKELIDEELTRAKAKVASGTSPATLYEALIRDGRAAPEPETKNVALSPTAPSRGNAAGKVVIQEFCDFQSPFCARVEDTLKEVLRNHGTQVKLVWRHMPLAMHADAMLAAEASAEAQRQKGNDGFFKMHAKLLQHQAAPNALQRAALDTYAREIGLDAAAFANALDQHVHKPKIEAEAKVGTDAGVSGTPGFVIGGYYLSGSQPYAKFRRLIERVAQNGPAKFVAPSTKLGITDVQVGTGATVAAGDMISVHYVGTLTNGSEFDSSRKRGTPFKFKFGQGQVIKGWEQGLVGMRVGGRRKLSIPAALGYGERGAPPTIPPNSTLLFDIELISIP